MIIYIETNDEIQFVEQIRKLNPNAKIENCICEYKPINEYPDPLCDNCSWQDYNDEIGYEFCSLKMKEL